MAYNNLTNIIVESLDDYFQHIRDFMCSRNGTYDYSASGIGWTLHDSSYSVDEDTLTSGDYFVMYSSGEDGTRDIYIKIEFRGSATAMYFHGYNYWNNVTHTGTGLHGGTGVSPTSPEELNLYGDLNSATALGLTSGQHWPQNFGMMPLGFRDTTVVTCAHDLASGASTVATLSAVPTSFKVGNNISVRDNNSVERAEIIAISGNDVTLSLTNSYANADNIRISERILNYCCRFSQSMSSNYGYMLLNSAGQTGSAPYGAISITGAALNDPWNAAADELQALSIRWSFDGYNYDIKLSSSAIADGTLYTAMSGTQYRSYKVYSGKHFLFKEV